MTTAQSHRPGQRSLSGQRGRLGHRRLAASIATVASALLILTGCTAGTADTTYNPAPSETAEAAPAPATTPVACENPTQSYEPTDGTQISSGSTMAEIRDRGSLIVGVSADTLLMSSRDPLTGKIQGFDMDILHEISDAIFGDPDKLQIRVITSGQRLEVLENNEVDLVARTFTINCERWDSIAFSAEYYHAGQKVLVTRDSDATGIEDLAGQRVCAPAGTTTLARLADYPDIEAVSAQTHTACLVLFQQSKVDAITGDDTILAGFVAQDPYAKVVGDAFSDEPYGVGVPAENVDMVRFVNAVLEDIEEDGTWADIYTRWLGDLGPAPAAPTPVYGRTP